MLSTPNKWYIVSWSAEWYGVRMDMHFTTHLCGDHLHLQSVMTLLYVQGTVVKTQYSNSI